MTKNSPYRQPDPSAAPPASLQALSEAGRRRRAEYQRAAQRDQEREQERKQEEEQEEDQKRLAACVQPSSGAQIVIWLVGLPLIFFLCVVAGALVGRSSPWLVMLCGCLGIAVLRLVQCSVKDRLRQHAIEALLDWPASLPFPLVGWQCWLKKKDEHFYCGTFLWISWVKPAPRELVADALAAVVPDSEPRWLDDRQVGLELDVGRHEICSGDVAKLQQLVCQVLIPLHGSLPLSQVELSRESFEARATRQREELADRGRALAENREGLAAAEQLAALEALRRQALDLQLDEWDRENLDKALASALRRAILYAEQARDGERAQLLREAAAAWGIDLSKNSLLEEQALLQAERAGTGSSL